MLYTNEVKTALRSFKSPVKGLILDVVEYDGIGGNYLAVRVYRDNFESYPQEAKLLAADYIRAIINTLRMAGIPTYLEALQTPPKIKPKDR